jgi:hypothetical protein
MNGTKICKYCKTEIPKDAKICPNCKKKQKGKLGIVLAVVVVLLVIGAVAGGGSDDEKKAKIDNSGASTSKKSTSTDKAQKNATKDKKDGVVKVGGSFEDNGLKFSVNNAEMDYKVKDQYGIYKLDDGLVYLAVDFTFENTGDSDKYVSIYDFKCYADNKSCEQQFVTEDTGDFINTNLSAGRNVAFKTLYAVPADAKSIELEYESNVWTDEKVVVKIK